MKTFGVIAEFNPLHEGHIAHIDETRAITGCEYIVAAISGNFVQRGEPAIFNKWARTEVALESGVDIVVEIPVPYVISGADYFARGSVGVLAATNVVDWLSFGSEWGNLAEIEAAGRVLAREPSMYKEVLHLRLGEGSSFAAARGAALAACMSGGELPDGFLTKPNNCLGMEYCKANFLLGEPFKMFTTHRRAGGPSATRLRKELVGVSLDDFSDIFKYLLYTSPSVDLLGEGVGNRFKNICGNFTKISDMLDAVKTKRYTFTRLQRDVLRVLLNIYSADMDYFEENGGVQYIRILGFRKSAAGLVGEITKKASLPVLTHGRATDRLMAGGGAAAKMLKLEFSAGDIYRVASKEKGGVFAERGKGIVVV